MNDDLMFSDEENSSNEPIAIFNNPLAPWRILVIDDEPDVHVVTKMVLSSFVYADRKLEISSAYSGEAAKEMLRKDANYAVALVDVVMESDDAGLNLVRWIRTELKNNHIRLILRTGQPGMAPEDEVIRQYEINDYKAKSELSAQKLVTTMFASLRAYRDILIIERTRHALEMMLDASTDFFTTQAIEKFTHGLMTQLTALLKLDFNDMRYKEDGIILFSPPSFTVYSSCGVFGSITPQSELSAEEISMLKIAEEENLEHLEKTNVTQGTQDFLFRLETSKEPLAIFIRTTQMVSDVDRKMVLMFIKKTASTLENLILQEKHRRAQEVTIRSLAKLAEYRDSDTGEHLDRVELFCSGFAQHLQSLGMFPNIITPSFASMIGPASVLHDIGKVGIPDSILLKEGKLNETEWELMQQHVLLGSNVLSNAIELSHYEDDFLVLADQIARCHHENWNGEGYPMGLKGDDIPLSARIMALVDVYDALTSERPYKVAWSNAEAINWINNQSGIKFDPTLVPLFVDYINEIVI